MKTTIEQDASFLEQEIEKKARDLGMTAKGWLIWSIAAIMIED